MDKSASMHLADSAKSANPANPTGRDYHAPHEPKPAHSLNDPLQTVAPNPKTGATLLNQDPKFGNATESRALNADGTYRDKVDGRTLNADGQVLNADGTYGDGVHNADGTLRNPPFKASATHNADGTIRKRV